jgi:translation initiation factor 2 beta subunit (eIF-2beta)/eIF-5
MAELNQEPQAQGNSIQEPAEPVVEPTVEPAEGDKDLEASVDKLFEDKKFVDTFFSRVGDGVAKIVDKRVEAAMSQLETNQPEPSQQPPVNPVEPAAAEPAMAPTQQGVENLKDGQDDELAKLKAKVSELEGSNLNESIKNLEEIKQLNQASPEDAERFIQRIAATAQANNVSPSEVLSDGSSIQRDIQNQLAVLNGTQPVLNKPNKEPIVADSAQKKDKWAEINAAFLKQ